MELKILNEIREEIKQFNSPEEFDIYYRKHKDELNSQTTQYLNRVYRIKCADGTEYRITKKNCSKQDGKRVGGDIYLKKIVKTSQQADDDDENINELRYTNLQADITTLKQQIESMKNTINEIVRVINGDQ